MKITFDTHDYGKIECNDESKLAYFVKDDLESPIDKNGEFRHPFTNQRFAVLWPIGPKWLTTALQVMRWKTISEV